MKDSGNRLGLWLLCLKETSCQLPCVGGNITQYLVLVALATVFNTSDYA